MDICILGVGDQASIGRGAPGCQKHRAVYHYGAHLSCVDECMLGYCILRAGLEKRRIQLWYKKT
jgi:hypothetical protein